MTDEGINPDMIKYYGRADWARRWDSGMEAVMDLPEYKQQFDKISEVINEAVAGKNVLEIAAGTGIWTRRIVAVIASLVATDINEAPLKIAQEKEYPPGKVSFRIGDMYSLGDVPQKDALFGGFIISHVLRQGYTKFFDTLNARVVPGGTIILFDTKRLVPPTRIDAEGNYYDVRKEPDGTKHEVLKNHPSQEELRELLRERASHIEFLDMEHYWLLKYETQK